MTRAPAAPDRALLTGRVVLADDVVADGAVAVEHGTVRYAGRRTSLPQGWSTDDVPAGWPGGLTLLPGLVDIHCHGGLGGEFGSDLEGARAAAAYHHASGTTSVVGSLVSAPAEALLEGARILGTLVAVGELAGIHLEGPFLSTVRCGAQNPDALIDADPLLVERLAAAAGPGALLQMTWAPDRDRAQAVPGALAAVGALAALGHTDADFATATAALQQASEATVRGGRPVVTHVFNGMAPLLSRAPGAVGAALAAAGRGEAVLEVIADGVHLDGGTVRMLFDTLGADRLALVSDAMIASGLPEGTYTLGGLGVEVKGREARLVKGGSLAGGVSVLLEQVRWLVQDLGIGLQDAVRAATATPARALALTEVGELVAGHRADLVVVDDELTLKAVMRAGNWL